MSDEQNNQQDQPNELTPEEQLLESKKLLWEAAAQAVREKAQERQYLTLTELSGHMELEKDSALALMAEIKEQEGFGDIFVYKGAKDLYYYSYPALAHNYVKSVAMAQEDDLPRIIAEVARFESKTYPRATAIETFHHCPYHYTDIQVKRMLERMARQEEYQDIQPYESSRKNFYIFSTKHLSLAYASTLVEMSEDKRLWM